MTITMSSVKFYLFYLTVHYTTLFILYFTCNISCVVALENCVCMVNACGAHIVNVVIQ